MNRQHSLFTILLMIGSLSIVQAAEINAVLEWADQRELGSTVSGEITRVTVRPGMSAAKGNLLLEFDQRNFKAMSNKTIAAVHSAKLLMEEAQREQDRAIELYDRTVLSDFDRQQADIGLAKARSHYAEARAARVTAAIEQEQSRIVAPYNAVILDVSVGEGEVVVNENQARVLITVARSNAMLASALVSSDQLSSVKVGQSLEVAFRGQWRKGELYSIKPQSNGQYRMHVLFSVAKDDNARAGEASAIRLPD